MKFEGVLAANLEVLVTIPYDTLHVFTPYQTTGIEILDWLVCAPKNCQLFACCADVNYFTRCLCVIVTFPHITTVPSIMCSMLAL